MSAKMTNNENNNSGPKCLLNYDNNTDDMLVSPIDL